MLAVVILKIYHLLNNNKELSSQPKFFYLKIKIFNHKKTAEKGLLKNIRSFTVEFFILLVTFFKKQF